jgi:hypothetical protein
MSKKRKKQKNYKSGKEDDIDKSDGIESSEHLNDKGTIFGLSSVDLGDVFLTLIYIIVDLVDAVMNLVNHETLYSDYFARVFVHF